MLQYFFSCASWFLPVVLAKELCRHQNGFFCWCVFFSVNLKDVYNFFKINLRMQTYLLYFTIYFSNKNSLTTSSSWYHSSPLLALNYFGLAYVILSPNYVQGIWFTDFVCEEKGRFVKKYIYGWIDEFLLTATWFVYCSWSIVEPDRLSEAYRTFRTHGRFVPRRFVPKVEMIRTQR